LSSGACADRRNASVNSDEVSPKPGVPISISYMVQNTVVPGEESTISITINVSADIDELTLRLRPSAGLVITSDEKEMHLGSLKRKSIKRKTITVTMQKEGNYYINLIVTGWINGKKVAKTMAIPILTENAPKKLKKSRGTVTTDSRGERMIILPAEESGN
ncbi:MAG: hypothetical protein GXO97_06650, partial [Nitrospirae bacterium]|nr:hypothetical protein [Nitrospirota bacterium]